jgi:uncharacterized repeat protein (TIGR03847 family)
MPPRIFVFDPPDRFVAGTVGLPGQRTFFLQARKAGQVVSVVLEKVQVAALAERLDALLDELESHGVAETISVSATAIDSEPLDEPINEAFRATTLTLGWDVDAERVLIEARAPSEDDEVEGEEVIEVEDDDEDGPDLLRVRLTAEAARTFVERAYRVIRAGRPPCPLCGNPLDATGHICPRKNGHYVN